MNHAEISWCAHHDVVPGTGSAVEWVATRSLRNQEDFLHGLAAAQSEAGVPEQLVAQRLGLSLDDLKKALEHPGDLTVDELRLLSIAAEVVISYRVRAAHREYSDQQRALRRMTRHVRESVHPDESRDLEAVVKRAVAQL